MVVKTVILGLDPGIA